MLYHGVSTQQPPDTSKLCFVNVFVYLCCSVSVVFYLFLSELFRNKVRTKTTFSKGVLITAGHRL